MSDFSLPDFRVPELDVTDLTMPDFTMPDANLPDPPSPDLMQPLIPLDLDVLASSVNLASPALNADHPESGYPLAMPDMPDEPDGPDEQGESGELAQDMPGTLDSSAQSLVLDSPDNRQLPAGLAYDALNSTAGLTTRERHMGMLLLGLEGKGPVDAVEGTGQ
jgi:hypothetical protein